MLPNRERFSILAFTCLCKLKITTMKLDASYKYSNYGVFFLTHFSSHSSLKCNQHSYMTSHDSALQFHIMLFITATGQPSPHVS